MIYAIAVAVLFLVVATSVHHLWLCEAKHEVKLSRMADRSLGNRLDALQDDVLLLNRRLAAIETAGADDVKAAARLVLVDALQTTVDSLSYVRGTEAKEPPDA